MNRIANLKKIQQSKPPIVNPALGGKPANNDTVSSLAKGAQKRTEKCFPDLPLLPKEIFQRIISYLKIEEWCQYRLVHPTWNAMALINNPYIVLNFDQNSPENILKGFYNRNDPSALRSQFTQDIKKFFSFAQDAAVKIRLNNLSSSPQVPRVSIACEMLKNFSKCIQNIERLDVSISSIEEATAISEILPKFNRHIFSKGSGSIKIFFHSSLPTLKIMDAYNIIQQTNCNALIRFSVDSLERAEKVLEIMLNDSELKTVEITTTIFDDIEFAFDLHISPHLHAFNLHIKPLLRKEKFVSLQKRWTPNAAKTQPIAIPETTIVWHRQ